MAKILAHLKTNGYRKNRMRFQDDFGLPKFGCLQLKVRDEKNLPVLKTTSGSALAQ